MTTMRASGNNRAMFSLAWSLVKYDGDTSMNGSFGASPNSLWYSERSGPACSKKKLSLTFGLTAAPALRRTS